MLTSATSETHAERERKATAHAADASAREADGKRPQTEREHAETVRNQGKEQRSCWGAPSKWSAAMSTSTTATTSVAPNASQTGVYGERSRA